MRFQNFSANVDAVRDTMCYIHRCEGFSELVLEVQGIELPHRYAKIFRAYHMAITGHTTQLLEYGLTQDGKYRLHYELNPLLSTTVSFETAFQVLLVCDGRQLLPRSTEFELKYRNDVRPPEAYAADFEPDPQFLCFAEDPRLEGAVRQGFEGTGKRQYLANFFRPTRETGAPIPVIYFAIQVAYPIKLKAPAGVDNVLAAVRKIRVVLGIDRDSQFPHNIFYNYSPMKMNLSPAKRWMAAMAYELCNQFSAQRKAWLIHIWLRSKNPQMISTPSSSQR